MKLLCDENFEQSIIKWLRDEGNDVLWAAESIRQTPDDELLSLACAENRVLLTSDLDFGELVFRKGLLATGVVLVRFRAINENQRLKLFQQQWAVAKTKIPGNFVVIRNRQIRIRPLEL